MRYLLAAVIVAAFPAVTAGQPSAVVSPPAPSIGLPLPSIGLPLPAIGLDPSMDRPAGPVNTPPPGAGRGRHFPPPTIVFFGAPYAFGVDPSLQSLRPGVIAPPAVEVEPPPAPTGILRLEIEPSDIAQVFVDGEYVGRPADLDGQLELAPGTRRIEVRARGYETLDVDVRIVPGRSITYRETLNRAGGAGGTGKVDLIPSSPTSPIRPAGPPAPKTTFYLIPGCYLGNVHPDLVKLPEGCDLSRMITHTPP